MSIDNFFFGPAGCRNLKDGKRIFERMERPNIRATRFSVELNHGLVECEGEHALCLVDDLFCFETEEDACWFAAEGYKRMLYEGEIEADRVRLDVAAGDSEYPTNPATTEFSG